MSARHFVSLSSIAEIIQGGRLKLSGNDFVESGVPAYGAGGLNGYLEVVEFNRPAIVLSSIGARCGKCFYVDGPWTSLANTQLIFPDLSRVDPKYLWYQLNDEDGWIRSGTAQPFIKPSNVKNRMVKLPGIPEQRRIAAILDKTDALRIKRREAIAKLEKLEESVFVDMFGDQSSGIKAWPVQSLAELVNEGTIVTYGIVQAGEEYPGGVPYIRTGDIVDGQIKADGLRRTNPALAGRFSRSKVDPGDIVMSIRATVGTTALVPDCLAGANLTQGTARIAVGEKLNRYYALHHLRSRGTQAWIQKQVKGATFREITLGRLRELPVMVPPRSLQDEFAEICIRIALSGSASMSSLERLEVLFSSARQRAFSGVL